MNLTKLEYFKAVCENQSICLASEQLHISQPSLSACIKDLENEFGVALFRRHHKGMALTEAGEILYKLSTSLIDHAEQIKRTMLELGVGKKLLRLGVPPMIGSLVLPLIYKDYQANLSNVELQISEAGTRELTKLLRDNQLDVIIIPHVDEFDNEFKSIKMTDFEIVCCVRKDNALCGKKRISPKDLQEQKVVLFKNSFFQTEQIKRWFSLSQTQPKILLQTDQLSTLTNIIESGQAVGFMFKQLIKDNSSLIALPLKTAMNIKTSIVWKANEQPSFTMKAFIDYVKKIKV